MRSLRASVAGRMAALKSHLNEAPAPSGRASDNGSAYFRHVWLHGETGEKILPMMTHPAIDQIMKARMMRHPQPASFLSEPMMASNRKAIPMAHAIKMRSSIVFGGVGIADECLRRSVTNGYGWRGKVP